jgi:tetratricopeptide (TPR) repeat protein
MVLIALSAVFFGGYLSELGKKLAPDNGAKGKAEPGIQIDQIKTGDQSKVFVGSQVTILGVPQEVVQRLLKNLEEKDVAIEELDASLQKLAQLYKDLRESLIKRSAEDDLVAQAKKKLDEGSLEGAKKLLLQSYKKNLQSIAENKKAAAADAFGLGLIKKLQLDYTEAKNFFEKAVELEPDNSDYLNRLGSILNALGDHREAIDYYEKALDIDVKTYGAQHPNVARDYNNLGVAWRELGEYSKAIDYYEKALAADLKVFGEKHPNVARDYNNLGVAWNSLGETKKAIDYLEMAFAIYLEVFDDQHAKTKLVKSNLESLKKK